MPADGRPGKDRSGHPLYGRIGSNYTRHQSSWASSSVFAQIPLRSTHGTYRGPTLVSVTASLAATAIRARKLGVLEPWWRMINRSVGSVGTTANQTAWRREHGAPSAPLTPRELPVFRVLTGLRK